MFSIFFESLLLFFVCRVIIESVSSETNTSFGLQRFQRQITSGGVCVLPDPLQNGRYRPSGKRCGPGNSTPACSQLPGAYVPPNWVLYFTCDDGYVHNTANAVAVCYNGQWIPSLPVCNKLCPPLKSFGVDVSCVFSGKNVTCNQPMRPGTVATQLCKQYYHTEDVLQLPQLTCLDNGAWDLPPSYCIPDDICKQQGDLLWSCKKISQCPKAQEALKTGTRPDTCYFSGSDPFVCCEPQISPGQNPQREVKKSKQKCKEYGKAVYIDFESPEGDEHFTIDTCAVTDGSSDGIRSQPREFPHMALIGYKNLNPKGITWSCGGSLISERFVLTSATCSGRSYSPSVVRLGDYNAFSTQDDEDNDARSEEYEIVDIIIHPEYNNNNSYYNDIALLKLKEDVTFNEYVRPICLQTEHTFANTYAVATGWGSIEFGGKRSDILKKVNLTIIERKKCNQYLSDLQIFKQLPNGVVDASMVCAKHFEDGYDTCQGDGGGPLQIRLQDPYCMYSQVGITSFGVRCASGYPSIYTRVSHYVPWIESIVWP